MIAVTLAPNRIAQDVPSEIKLSLTNESGGPCTHLILDLQLPLSIVLIKGNRRLELLRLDSGGTYTHTFLVRGRSEGKHQVKVQGFSFRGVEGKIRKVSDSFYNLEVTRETLLSDHIQLQAKFEAKTLNPGEWTKLRGWVTNISNRILTGLSMKVEGDIDYEAIPIPTLDPGTETSFLLPIRPKRSGLQIPIIIRISSPSGAVIFSTKTYLSVAVNSSKPLSQKALPDYEAFELRVDHVSSQGYPIIVTHSAGGEGSIIRYIDYKSFQLASEKLARSGPDVQILESFGRQLFNELFSGEVASLYRSSTVSAQAQGKGMRICLRIEPPELMGLPWELLYDSVDDSFLGAAVKSPLSRYVSMSNPVRPLKTELPIRVLVILSSPSGMPPIDIQGERQVIENAMAEWIARDWISLEFVYTATTPEINHAIRRFRPHVFHFVGHGDFKNGEGIIFLKNQDEVALPMDGRTFKEFFAGVPDTRLVVLNTCQSAQISTTKALISLAPRILQRQLPAVVAMQHSIPDQSAKIFSREFYRSLVLGYPVDVAANEARRGILMEAGMGVLDWSSPVVFMRVQDGRLFDFEAQRRY